MQKIKKIIIWLSIIIMIIILALIIIFINRDEVQENNNEIPEQSTEISEKENTFQLVQDRMQFYTIKDCVDKYYLYYSRIFNAKEYCTMTNPDNTSQEIIVQYEQENSEVLYNMIDEEYIQYKSITADNIKTKLVKIQIPIVNITDMYAKKINDNMMLSVVKGMLAEKQTKNIRQFHIIIKIDTDNGTFSIIPQEYVEEKYINIELEKETKVIIPEKIHENKNNKYKTQYITDDIYVQDLVNQVENRMNYFTEQVYNTLDQDYKKLLFKSFEDFKDYVESKQNQYYAIQVERYQKIVIDDKHTQYICIDRKGNSYIFKETSPFQYTLKLDDYSLPTAEFTEEYNKQTEAEKVVLNIQRFFMGINDKNYGYSYSVLSESFKNNKYPTKNEFINYAKQNFFEENEIEYITYEKENGVYIYKIKIKDATGKSEDEKILNMIVRLKDGTDFEMSFGE